MMSRFLLLLAALVVFAGTLYLAMAAVIYISIWPVPAIVVAGGAITAALLWQAAKKP